MAIGTRSAAGRALVVTQDLTYPAGAMVYARRVVEELHNSGWQLTVWTNRRPTRDPELLGKADWHESPDYFRDGHGVAGRIRRLRAERALAHLVTRCRPTRCLVLADVPRALYGRLSRATDVQFFLHGVTHTCPQDIGLRFLQRSRLICPIVAGRACLTMDKTERCLGDRPQWRKLQRVWRVRRDLRSLGAIGLLVANSAYVAELYRRNRMELRPRILEPHIATCGPELDHVKHDAARKNLLYAGRIEEHKGAVEAVEILALLPPAYRLTLIGCGSGVEAVRRRSSELGLDARVELAGSLGEAKLAERRRASGLLLMPALCAEAFGMSGPEALCSGTPVVAYDVGGVSSWCGGEAAVTVPIGDRAEAASAVIRMTSETARWRELCQVASDYGAARFSADHWRAAFYALLEEGRLRLC